MDQKITHTEMQNKPSEDSLEAVGSKAQVVGML